MEKPLNLDTPPFDYAKPDIELEFQVSISEESFTATEGVVDNEIKHYPQPIQDALKILLKNDTGHALITSQLGKVSIRLVPLRITETSYFDQELQAICLCKHETPIFMAMDIVHFLSLLSLEETPP